MGRTYTKRDRDEISAITGFDAGAEFEDEDAVRAYFTVGNMDAVIGADHGWDQETLSDMADIVVCERWHMVLDYLTTSEAAALSGTSESGWRNRAAAGKIPGAWKAGRDWMIPRSAVVSEAGQ